MITEYIFLYSLKFEAKKFIFYQKHACERIATSNFEFTQIFFLGAGHNQEFIK